MRTITTHESIERKPPEGIPYKDLPIGTFFTLYTFKEESPLRLLLLKTEMSSTDCPVVASISEMKESSYKKVGSYVMMELNQKVYPINFVNIQYTQ